MVEILSLRFLTPLRWFSLLAVGLLILGGSAWVAVRLGPRYDGSAERIADVPASILWSIRVPRVWAAIVVGWTLGVAGALYQGMLQNPLADPYLLGVSGGAALGVTLAVPWDWTGPWPWVPLPMVAAFAGALAFTFLVYGLARVRGQLPVYSLILAGVVLNAVAAAFILLVTVTREYFQVQRVALWMIGQIQPLAYPFLITATVWVLVWTLGAWRDAPYLNLLLLGEDVPAAWGLAPDRLRVRWLIIGAALAAMTVAMAGMVGFVGLIVPHAVRLVVGYDFRKILPLSAVVGALVVLWSDTLARTLWAPTEIPVGALTATLAGPYFLWLLRRTLHRGVPL